MIDIVSLIHRTIPALSPMWAVTALLLGVGLVYTKALAAQTDAPIRIHAGSIQIDQKSGKIIYRNKVRLSQGNMTIMADKITSRTRYGNIESVIATGSPVLVQHAADATFQATAIQAKRLEYAVAKRSLVMSGQVRLRQGLDTLHCDRITYLVPSRTLSATTEGNERIRASFMPRSKPTPAQPLNDSAL